MTSEHISELLTAFYIDQYRENAHKNRKKGQKGSHYLSRINSKARTLSHMHVSSTEGNAVTAQHMEVVHLAGMAYQHKNREAIAVVNGQLLPGLVRLDLMLFPKDYDWSFLDEEFLHRLKKERNLQICRKNFYEICQQLRQEELREQIIELVPSRPETEFPQAIEMERSFILHVGPTNSGKTYQALERLKTAQKGVYLGPLRLLALEVYEKMMNAGIPCTMLTGQECIEEPDSRITASTVEMMDLDQVYDIAVIDEAQMVCDADRGHSWTRAILGTRAREIHICMSPVAEGVVTHLIELTGDHWTVRRYERKTPLLMDPKPFDFPEDVEEADALIVFSKKAVLNIAARLEEKGIHASVIYGSLPPEIRRRQMELFNSGETKIVVSTDAIGMGLNLPVRRIVFLEMNKFDGTTRRPLLLPEILQIAGRAGRFGLYETGRVTAMGSREFNYLKFQMGQIEEPITRVSLGFPQVLLGMDAPLDVIVSLWHEAKPAPPFEKITIDEMMFLYSEAEKNRHFIDGFDDKRILYRMVTCPVDIKDREVVDQWRRYIMSYTADISLERPQKWSRYKGLQKHESYYKKLDLYYQLSVRLGKLVDTEWLEEERERTQNSIMQLLSRDKNEYIIRCKYCGKVLPLNAHYNLCDSCFSYRPDRAGSRSFR